MAYQVTQMIAYLSRAQLRKIAPDTARYFDTTYELSQHPKPNEDEPNIKLLAYSQRRLKKENRETPIEAVVLVQIASDTTQVSSGLLDNQKECKVLEEFCLKYYELKNT